MTQWGILRDVQLLRTIEPMISLEIYKVQKLDLVDKSIDFERSNQITQSVELLDQIKEDDRITSNNPMNYIEREIISLTDWGIFDNQLG